MATTQQSPALETTSHIRTARNVDHVAMTVPDLDAAVAFFTEIFGAQYLYRINRVADDGTWMTKQLGVHPRAEASIVMMRLDTVTNLELFEYRSPDQNPMHPSITDVGTLHLAVTVGDIDEATAALRRNPLVRVLGEVMTIPDGPIAGNRWIYFRSAWGGFFELQQWPAKSPFERSVPVRLHRLTTPTAGSGIPTAYGVAHRANSDVGGNHLAFYVDDVDEAARHLAQDRLQVMGVPQLITDGGPIDGDRWVYFRAPWGMQLEILNMPPGMPYERTTTARRYGPAPAWTNA